MVGMSSRLKQRTLRALARRCVAIVAVSVLAAALGVPIAATVATRVAAAANALLSCSSATTYTLRASGAIYSTDVTTGATTLASNFGVAGVDALGLNGAGSRAFAVRSTNASTTSTLYDDNVATATVTTSVVTIASGLTVVGGSVDPANGLYYFGGFSNPTHAGNQFLLYAFDPSTKTQIGAGPVAKLAALANSAVGDITFDATGHVYLIQGGSALSLDEVDVTTVAAPSSAQSPAPTLNTVTLSSLGSSTSQFNGASFDANGTLYVQFSIGGSTPSVHLDSIDPNSGLVLSNTKMTGSGAATGANGNSDLGSCVTPGSLDVVTNVQSRVSGADQFTLATSANATTLSSATTTGGSTGLQSVSAGAVVAHRASSYTVSETAANGADLRDYSTSYSCVDLNNSNAVVVAGKSTSATFLFPAPIGSHGANVQCTFNNAPGLTIVKSASPSTVTTAGTVITYSFAVTNSSAVSVSSLSVLDSPVAPTGSLSSGPSCPVSSLAPGASTTCVGTYIVTASDITHGSISGSAVAQATPAGGVPYSSAPSSVTVTVTSQPALSIVKSASPTSVTTAGTVITYSFVVTNTGNVSLINLIVHDTPTAPAGALTGNPTCPATSLEPTSSMVCAGTYVATQADIDNGSISDSATVTGTPPSGPSVSSPSSSATVSAPADPALSIVKSASPTSVTTAGTVITYSFLVANTGNVTISGVAVNDALQGISSISCPSNVLAPSDMELCISTYVASQKDIDAGSIINLASATGIEPNGQVVAAPDSSFTVTASDTAQLSLLTTAGVAFYSHAGESLPYEFLVINTGNTDLSNVSVLSDLKGISKISCPRSELPVGHSMSCTASYVATKADLKAGLVINLAVASGDPVVGSRTYSPPSGVIVSAIHKNVKVTG